MSPPFAWGSRRAGHGFLETLIDLARDTGNKSNLKGAIFSRKSAREYEKVREGVHREKCVAEVPWRHENRFLGGLEKNVAARDDGGQGGSGVDEGRGGS